MFPLVPYHALPELHKLVKDDCPPVYQSIYSAWKEILPTLLKQVKDPSYYVRRKLPDTGRSLKDTVLRSDEMPNPEGWIKVCDSGRIRNEEAIRFDHQKKTYALFRDKNGKLYATDGICTHGNTHLGDGLVIGNTVECPKHNGRFNLEDGTPVRPPVCLGLAIYPVEERNESLWLNIKKAGGAGARVEKSFRLQVVSNSNVSTFIKELVLEPVDASEKVSFIPGDYLQFEIPEYKEIRFAEFNISEPYATVWKRQGLFNMTVSHNQPGRRNNYSLAGNVNDRKIMFNVRIAFPPPGQDCPPGVGSSFMFSLKPGDTLTAYGPYGDFHIKPTKKEIVFVGGGAGMAPIRAQIVHLFENEATDRKVSYWYGARSKQEIYYENYFRNLTEKHHNFSFHLALSNPLEEDNWMGEKGLIHDVVYQNYLKDHPNISSVEFYLCGPPMMIKACTKMLTSLGVRTDQISFDEF
jgi:MocE subfamily Rieske [2Fe-2S] domain protein